MEVAPFFVRFKRFFEFSLIVLKCQAPLVENYLVCGDVVRKITWYELGYTYTEFFLPDQET